MNLASLISESATVESNEDNKRKGGRPRKDVGEGEKTADKRKQSLYFPSDMLQEMQAEADRLDRSLSWVVQRAWKLSRAQLNTLPSVEDVG